MVRSMTGFGRGAAETDHYRAVCEVKSVNHRYFEFSARAPRSCGFLEERLKRLFQGLVARGKVECYVSLEFLGGDDTEVKVNAPLLAGYLEAFRAMESGFGVRNDIAVSSLLRAPDLFQIQKKEIDEEAVWEAVRQAAEDAAQAFIAMREAEGQRLRDDILARAGEILAQVAFIEGRSPQTVREYNEKLLGRMRELLEGASVDEQRLLTEAAIFADKIAVAEETVRLRSHLAQLAVFLENGKAAGALASIGRKMDFLVQEINREANTVGSKSADIEIARSVVEIKSGVEKIREQVQNIE
jgi:uncharacterized protein (TIGR00255 family)